uniref:Thrombopoietin-like n=1 Tax=Acanthochromis polyacanthus TaxID=80966 RepID=A0A3Q1GBM9_9TELE
MAYSRLLLLLIGVISTHLPEVHARPIDFWCKNDSRKKMIEMIAEWADCVTSDTLPSPVQLPCVGFRMTEWTNKTLQQKRAEVLGALQVFEGGVQSVMSQVTLPCQTSLLEKLKNSIRNYLAIVKTLPIQSLRSLRLKLSERQNQQCFDRMNARPVPQHKRSKDQK